MVTWRLRGDYVVVTVVQRRNGGSGYVVVTVVFLFASEHFTKPKAGRSCRRRIQRFVGLLGADPVGEVQCSNVQFFSRLDCHSYNCHN